MASDAEEYEFDDVIIESDDDDMSGPATASDSTMMASNSSYLTIDPEMFWELVDLIREIPRDFLLNHPLYIWLSEIFDQDEDAGVTLYEKSICMQMPTGQFIRISSVTDLFHTVQDYCHNVLPLSDYHLRINEALATMVQWVETEEAADMIESLL